MKKILVFLMMLSFVVPMVMAVQTSTYLQNTSDASAKLSALHANSASYSADLHAWASKAGNEGRVRIELPVDFTLDDLDSIAWDQYVETGYAAHVDVILDIDNDGTKDDALVFETAKVDPADCELNSSYPTGAIVTLGRGSVSDAGYAWLNSGDAGPGCVLAGNFYTHTLADWKLGPDPSNANSKTINGSVRVLALEIEVDAWIEESEAFIDDVMLNGELIEDFEGSQGAEGQVSADMTFMANPNPLMFGSLLPGQSKTVTSTLSVGLSSLKVMGIAVNSTIGTIFDEPNVLFSTNDLGPFVDATSISPIVIPASGSDNLYVKLSVPFGATPGSFAGTITYTVLEA